MANWPDSALRKVKVVAADIDDTVTVAGKIPAATIDAFGALKDADITCALVTGRSAGWAQTLAAYLPGVTFVIGENGFVMFDGQDNRWDLGEKARTSVSPEVLRSGADRLVHEFGLLYTPDDIFRLFERTLERPPAFDDHAIKRCHDFIDPGCEVVASSIHIHVRPRGWGKAEGLQAGLTAAGIDPVAKDEVVVIGDSANDRSLFRAYPATSVGVKNITRFLPELGPDRPRYVTEGESAAGFAEVVKRIVAAR